MTKLYALLSALAIIFIIMMTLDYQRQRTIDTLFDQAELAQENHR